MPRGLKTLHVVWTVLIGCALAGCAHVTPEDFQSQNSLQTALAERAMQTGVSAVSVTVFDDDGEVYSVHHGDGVSSGTLFQAASMSKSVAALAVLAVAHERNVDLDEDVRPHITSLNWEAIEGADRAITLRQLLSHTSGATVHGFPGYAQSTTLPTSVEIVTGEPPTNTAAVRFKEAKNRYSYSGGGYQILQLFIEDQTGQSFEGALQRLVLQPLDMTRSTFSQPIDPVKIGPLTIAGVKDGVWNNYPEQAAAGLWTTSADYSKFAAALQRALSGQDLLGLPKAMVRQLFAEVDDGYGLGLEVSHTSDGVLSHFGHGGANYGYRSIFRSYPERGEGIVVMTNSPQGAGLMMELTSAFAEH